MGGKSTPSYKGLTFPPSLLPKHKVTQKPFFMTAIIFREWTSLKFAIFKVVFRIDPTFLYKPKQ